MARAPEGKREPLYRRIENDLRAKIVDGTYAVGEKLPSERELCELCSVSRITVKQALANLVEDGLLVSFPGKGYFVPEPTEGAGESNDDSSGLAEVVAGHCDVIPGHGALAAPYALARRRRIVLGVLNELPDLAPLWREVIARFEAEEPGIDVELLPVNGLETFEDDSLPLRTDVIQVPSTFAEYLQRRGWFFDLDALPGSELSLDGFYPGLAEAASLGGRPVGVPVTAGGLCGYVNEEYADVLPQAAQVGFWEYLDALRTVAEGTPVGVLPSSLLVMRHSPFLLFQRACPEAQQVDDLYWNLGHPAMVEFLERLAPYARDSRLFLPHVDEMTHFRFFRRQAAIVWGSTSWLLSFFCDQCPFPFRVLPEPREPGGTGQAETYVNTVSSYTAYPSECVAFLKFLAQYETQRFLARRGRIVSHRDAMAELDLGLDDSGHEAIRQTLAHSARIPSSRPDVDDYLNAIVNPEMELWMKGISSTDVFARKVAAKTEQYTAMKAQVSQAAVA